MLLRRHGEANKYILMNIDTLTSFSSRHQTHKYSGGLKKGRQNSFWKSQFEERKTCIKLMLWEKTEWSFMNPFVDLIDLRFNLSAHYTQDSVYHLVLKCWHNTCQLDDMLTWYMSYHVIYIWFLFHLYFIFVQVFYAI